MKTLIATLSLFTIVGSAQARTPMQPKTLKSEINSAFLAKTGPLAGKEMLRGDIIVNQKARELTLYLELGPVCAPLIACPSYLMSKIVKLQNMTGKKDACGVETYSAELDQMPVDGIKEELTVVDYSKSTCPSPYYLPYIETQIIYKTTDYDRTESTLIKSKSVFYARKLEVSVVLPMYNY